MECSDQEKDLLRSTIAVLEEENAQLSERAEDAMLFGVVAEAIQRAQDPVEVVGHVLEKISILKNLPFVTCARLRNGILERVCSYSSFSNVEEIGYPIVLGEKVRNELRDGGYVCQQVEDISTTLTPESLIPSSIVIIPCTCHFFGNCLFLFFSQKSSPASLVLMFPLLQQVVTMSIKYLDNLFLTGELDRLNTDLEDRIYQKTAELSASNKQLRESHKLFETVLDGIDAYIYVVDIESYKILYLNGKSKEAFAESQLETQCYKHIKKIDTVCSDCKLDDLLALGRHPDNVLVWEYFHPVLNKWVLNREKIVPWPNVGFAKLTIATDITEIKEAEVEKENMQQSLVQAQKMEAVGVLAGSVAHDLNNILSGVVSYPDLLLANLTDDSPMRSPLETIQAAGKKAAAIVRDLLTLARRGIKNERPVEFRRLVQDYVDSAECMELLRRNPMVNIVAPDTIEMFTVLGSSVHLSSVLMNIVTNAFEAMADGGTITINLEKITLMKRPKGFKAWRAGDYVRLTVSDTGSGIPVQTQKMIFDPFFSGKTLGSSGTGLGLAIVWGTVMDHKGEVQVDSAEGVGTTFTILIPSHGGQQKELLESKEEELLKGQGQSILVVDDIEDQRQIATDILLHLGYLAVAVDSGEEALHYLKENQVDLVMLDMVMLTGIDGLETCKEILKLRPEQKIIIVSGYSQTEKVEEARLLGVHQYVSKPYTLLRIGRAIHQGLTKNK